MIVSCRIRRTLIRLVLTMASDEQNFEPEQEKRGERGGCHWLMAMSLGHGAADMFLQIDTKGEAVLVGY